MTDGELDALLAELEETRATAVRELDTIRGRRVILNELERDNEALLETYAHLTPTALDNLSSKERHHVYKNAPTRSRGQL